MVIQGYSRGDTPYHTAATVDVDTRGQYMQGVGRLRYENAQIRKTYPYRMTPLVCKTEAYPYIEGILNTTHTHFRF